MLGALCTVKIYIFTEIGDIEREKLEKSRLISVKNIVRKSLLLKI